MPGTPARIRGAIGAAAAALALHAPASAHNLVAVQDSTNPIVAATVSGNYTGCAWVDADGDGFLDLAIVRKPTMFRNLGNGQFAEASAALPSQSNALGTTWADYDNDGDLDCFLSANPGIGNSSSLYRNDGNFAFVKITTGDIGNHHFNSGWGSAFGDIDNDAWVDLVIAAANGFGGTTHVNRLLYNNGDGSFTNIDSTAVTDSLDAHTVPTWSDYDLDGDIDLFIGSGETTAQTPDNHFRNVLVETGSWGLERLTTAPIATDPSDGQVWNWIDYDNDGDLDAYQTNYSATPRNRLYRNDAGTYVSMTEAEVGPIVAIAGAGLASVWGDFDNDGDQDCVVTNDVGGPCDYFENDGDGTFTEETTSELATSSGAHYGASAGDYDRDGDLDLYVHGTTVSKRLYRNDLGAGSGWIELTLRGAGAPGGSNVAAIGAKVRAKATIGGVPVWQFREVSAQNSFNSMNMLDVHFGLGDAASIDSLVIEWPAGSVQVFLNVPANRVFPITEGVDPTGAPVPMRSGSLGLGEAQPNPFRAGTSIEFELARPARATLAVYDVGGRLVRMLVDAEHGAGRHATAWDGRDEAGRAVGSGVYFYRLDAAGESATKRVTRAR